MDSADPPSDSPSFQPGLYGALKFQAMPRDIIVLFEEMPPPGKIELSLRDFISEAGQVNWKRDRWIVDLPGKPEATSLTQPSRWLEVWIGQTCIDVMTRSADEFTNAVVTGFAQRIARQFGGKVEE